MSNSELKMISLEDISISKTNPRKTFDLSAQKDLIKSVKMHGILQPILIRPIPDDFDEKGNQKGYELVCGERRFKASKAAKLKEIPCNIRTLTDDEAFELQIIENLERKDVHPLEEADAFKRMLDSEKYTIEDIAAKMVKPESYIVQRLKFVDLIPELKEDFFKNEFGIGHAIILARLDFEMQKEQYEEAHTDNYYGLGYGTVKDLKENIDGELFDLDNAPFDTKDDTFPGVSSCMVCPKRSGANRLLFPDVEEDDICHDRPCYHNKVNTFIERRIAKIINEGEDIYLGVGWRGEPTDFVKELCKQHNVNILSDDEWSKEWNENAKKEAPQMIYVGGSDIGRIIPIRLKNINNNAPNISKENLVEDQITKIKERAKRSLELDNEKVEAAIREKINLAPEHNFFSDKPFTEQIETAAAILSIYVNLGYENRKWFQEEIAGIKGYYHDYGEKKIWDFILLNGNEIMLRELLRRLTFKTLTDRQVGDKESNGFSDAFYKLNELYHPADLQIIQEEQDEIAKQRILRTNAKLKKLKDSLNDK